MNLDKLTWYVARSGGIIAWSLLALSLILGLVLSSRLLGRKASPAWILSIHRFLGGLGVSFTAVHVAAIMLDDFVDFGVKEVLVPWASTWRPSAVAWGIIAMYLMIAIELTSFAMRRLPKSLWRGVHWMSAPLFVMASLHGYQSGADAGRAFILAIVAIVVVLTLLTVLRVYRARNVAGRVDPRELVAEAKSRKVTRSAAATRPPLTLPEAKSPPPLFDQREPALVATRPASTSPEAPMRLTEALPPVPPSLPVIEPREPLPEPPPARTDPEPGARSTMVARPDPAPVVVSASETSPILAAAPKPAWRPGPNTESEGPLSWVNADAEGNPKIRRRPGPVPGVWKRSERDLETYR